jgi:NTP pyrophosphatase (non-canonical NTP hydrolase)
MTKELAYTDPFIGFLTQYQAVIAQCCKHHKGSNTAALVDIVLGISTESGEVIGELKKFLSQNRDLDRQATLLEIGDLLFSLGALLNLLGLTFEDAIFANITKVKAKHITLTETLQQRIFDTADGPIDTVSSRKIQMLRLAIKVCQGRSIGVPHNEISDSFVDEIIEHASHHV